MIKMMIVRIRIVIMSIWVAISIFIDAVLIIALCAERQWYVVADHCVFARMLFDESVDAFDGGESE